MNPLSKWAVLERGVEGGFDLKSELPIHTQPLTLAAAPPFPYPMYIWLLRVEEGLLGRAPWPSKKGPKMWTPNSQHTQKPNRSGTSTKLCCFNRMGEEFKKARGDEVG